MASEFKYDNYEDEDFENNPSTVSHPISPSH